MDMHLPRQSSCMLFEATTPVPSKWTQRGCLTPRHSCSVQLPQACTGRLSRHRPAWAPVRRHRLRRSLQSDVVDQEEATRKHHGNNGGHKGKVQAQRLQGYSTLRKLTSERVQQKWSWVTRHPTSFRGPASTGRCVASIQSTDKDSPASGVSTWTGF